MRAGFRRVLVGLALLTFAVPGLGQTVSPTADVVYVRQDCGTMNDCFNSLPLAGWWLWLVRHPSATDPVVLEIGPGDFDPFDCPGGQGSPNGFVTLRGSGRDRTRIVRSVFQSGLGAITADDCEALTVQDLSIVGAGVGVNWGGGGSSQWFNVTLIANPTASVPVAIAWQDEGPLATPKAKHVWFSSTIRAVGGWYATIGISVSVSENWFYGSEIEADMSGLSPGGGFNPAYAASLGNVADLRLFGSKVRAAVGSHCGAGTVIAVSAIQSANFQMNGGLIAADGAPDNSSCAQTMHASGLVIGNPYFPGPARASTPGTAFSLKTSGAGVARRLQIGSTAKIESPFLWPPGPQPPAVLSLDGADLFVETDCTSTGTCSGGTEPHMMVSNAACGSKWFDATRGACRP
jgi:hypothetical protein